MGPISFEIDLATALTLAIQLQFAARHPIAGRTASARLAASFVEGVVRHVPEQFRPLFELCLHGGGAPERPQAEDVQELAEWALHVEISPGTTIAVLAQLGVALNQPVNRGASGALARGVALQLRAELPADIPALDAIMGDVLGQDANAQGPMTNDEGRDEP